MSEAPVQAGTSLGTGRSPAGDGPGRPFEFETRALGSALRLQVRGPVVQAAADTAWGVVRTEFEAVDAALSRFRDDSELTALNRLAGTDAVLAVSRRLRVALATVDRAGRMTGGLFDARVLGALERIGEHGAALSSGAGATLATASASAEATSGPQVELRRWPVMVPAQPLDMGGIGKGLALRWAVARALSTLPERAGLLLEAGGDLVAGGSSPAGGWLVGIEDPIVDPGPGVDPIAVVAVSGGAVATSSVRVRRWTSPEGQAVHHLVDPRTGEPARTGLIAVTVAADDPAWSEVWSKALFLAGRSRIADAARARSLAVWWIDDGGRLGMTPAARQRSAWVAEHRLG